MNGKHEKIKCILKIAGFCAAGVGVVAEAVGLILMAIDPLNVPLGLLLFLTSGGFILIFGGIGVLGIAFRRESVKYERDELAPLQEMQLEACPHCGELNAAGSLFCGRCGEKLQTVCPHCGAPVARGRKFCSRCGTKLF